MSFPEKESLIVRSCFPERYEALAGRLVGGCPSAPFRSLLGSLELRELTSMAMAPELRDFVV